MLYSQLNARNPSFDEKRVRRLVALYEGGKKFHELIQDFLPMRNAEHEERYRLRCKEARYRNYLGPIIDYFSASVFAAPLSVTLEDQPEIPDPYEDFLQHATRKGDSLDQFMREALTRAQVTGREWVRLHAQRRPEAIDQMSRAEFDDQKLGEFWISRPDTLDVLDWEENEEGQLLWVNFHSCRTDRPSIGASRNAVTERWEVVDAETVQVFQVSYEKGNKPHVDSDVPLIDSYKHGFGSIPVVCMVFDPAVHVASRLESPQVSHFRQSSALTWSLSTTCYAMPIWKLHGKEMPTMGSGLGVMVNFDEDVQWLAPPSAHFAPQAEEIKAEKDEIFRIANQLHLGVENNAAAIGRSGESKQADAASTQKAMIAFSTLTKQAVSQLLEKAVAFRGEDLEFEVGGLDDFQADDLGVFLEQLNLVADRVPSAKFDELVGVKIAESLLPDASYDDVATMRTEIKAGLEKQEAQNDEIQRLAVAAGALRGPGGDREGGSGVHSPAGPPGRQNKPPGRSAPGEQPD